MWIIITIASLILVGVGILIGLNINDKIKASKYKSNDTLDSNYVVPNINNDKNDDKKDNQNNENNSKTMNTTEPVKAPEQATKVEYSTKDNKVINELETTLNTINESQVTENFTKNAKKTFIDIVDFIFYGGEIKGVTFEELTDNGKEKVLELANKIDESIENKVPNYKDKISDTATKAFNNASKLIKKGSNNLNEFMKSKLAEDDYNAIIDAKDDLVYYSKNAVSFIKDNAPKVYNTLKDKLSTWYKNFKNNN